MCPIDGYFDTPFAVGGDLNPIPDAAQPSGTVSYEQGFPVGYSTPVASGGYNVPRTAFNQVLNDITTAIQKYQQNCIPPFITSAMNGGSAYSYSKYAMVLSGGVAYISLADTNTDTPPSANWAALTLAAPGVEAVTATSHTYAAADNQFLLLRSNAGVAMTDTLPGTSGALANGWYASVENTDATASLTVSVGSGGTINQGTTTGSFIVLPGETWRIQSSGGGVYYVGRVFNTVLAAPPTKSSFTKLAGTWATNTTATFTADELVVEDTHGNTRRLTGYSQTLNTGLTGAGGLDTGSLAASTWYYVYAVYNPTTPAASVIMSASASSPTLPAGYTFASGLIGAVYSDGSKNLRGFKQYGRDWQYVVGSNLTGLPNIISGSSGSTTVPTWTAASVSAVCPTAVASVLRVALGNNNDVTMVAPNNSYGAYTSTSNPPPGVGNMNDAVVNIIPILLESTNIYYAASSPSGFAKAYGFVLNI